MVADEAIAGAPAVLCRPYSIIDLLAILPFYLAIVLPVGDGRILRLLRLRLRLPSRIIEVDDRPNVCRLILEHAQ